MVWLHENLRFHTESQYRSRRIISKGKRKSNVDDDSFLEDIPGSWPTKQTKAIEESPR
jgi:hypothetical protein